MDIKGLDILGKGFRNGSQASSHIIIFFELLKQLIEGSKGQ